jgi:hypothetical protein
MDGSALDGIHLVWQAGHSGELSEKGYDIWRRRSDYRLEIICFSLTPEELDELHALLRLAKQVAVFSVRAGQKPDLVTHLPDEAIVPGPVTPAPASHGEERAAGGSPLPTPGPAVKIARRLTREETVLEKLLAEPAGMLRAGRLVGTAPLPGGSLVYEVAFDRVREMVSVDIGVQGGLAIAMRGAQAVDARALSPIAGGARVEFKKRKLDRVLLYVMEKATSLRVCYGEIIPEREEEALWRNADRIASGIQLPFQEVNSLLASYQDELALAKSRLLAGDAFSAPGFAELSGLMNGAFLAAHGHTPQNVCLLLRNQATEPFLEIAPWQYGLGITMSAEGRRMLGFSYLDPGGGLVPGDTYDYAIVGYFRRADLAERLYGFHTLPLQAELPSPFYLDDIRFSAPAPLLVETFPPVPPGALEHMGRKGVRLEQWLSIRFPKPVSHLVLELETDTYLGLQYQAYLETAGLFPIYGDQGAVPWRRRVELDFSSPMNRLDLAGSGFLYGVRTTTLAPGDDPDEVVTEGVIIPAVTYKATLPPDPPAQLGTVNLQTPLKMGKARDTVKQPLQNMGFLLRWLPPGQVPAWPADVDAAPPFEIGAFKVERRRVDTNAAFEPLGAGQGPDVPTLVGGNRGGRTEPQPIHAGADLLALFPEKKPAKAPVPPWMELEDVLWSPGNPQGPPPGSTHQYRIFSVDIIGRRSIQPALGSVVRLEKRLPPPLPPGPLKPAPAGRIVPRGVRARVIQASDPDLTGDDRTFLQGAQDAIVLEWGWGPQERRNDPFAREFRVYFQGVPPDMIIGKLVEQPVWNGTHYEMQVAFDQAVRADQFAGQYVNAGNYPFRIAGHSGGGGPGQVYLEPSQVHAGLAPAAGSLLLTPTLDGGEGRPPAWGARVHCQPIDGRMDYIFWNVFAGSLLPGPQQPSVRVWVGVSAADDQYYVPDELQAGAWSGRPGNESHIVAVAAVARHFGRPQLQGARPLFDVPEIRLDEVTGPAVTHALDVASWVQKLNLPAGPRYLVERISGAAVVAMLGATLDGRIQVTAPDGGHSAFRYGDNPAEPGNAADQAELLAALDSGEPARIAGKFLMDILWRCRGDDLSTLWQAVPGTPAAPASLTDTLPNKAERFIYRLRLADEVGHLSAGAALIPTIYRVPSSRVPGEPELGKLHADEGQVLVKLETLDTFDLAGVLIFYSLEDTAGEANPALQKTVQLLRVPNRPDLYPQDGIRLRLRDGTWAARAFVPRAAGVPNPAGRTIAFEKALAAGHSRRVSAWAVAVTRDGVPSLPAGPRVTTTCSPPPLVPALVVTTVQPEDRAQWAASEGGTRVTLEQSTDGGATWRRVSPWLRPDSTDWSVLAPAGQRRYRLRISRPDRPQDALGPAVQP